MVDALLRERSALSRERSAFSRERSALLSVYTFTYVCMHVFMFVYVCIYIYRYIVDAVSRERSARLSVYACVAGSGSLTEIGAEMRGRAAPEDAFQIV